MFWFPRAPNAPDLVRDARAEYITPRWQYESGRRLPVGREVPIQYSFVGLVGEQDRARRVLGKVSCPEGGIIVLESSIAIFSRVADRAAWRSGWGESRNRV